MTSCCTLPTASRVLKKSQPLELAWVRNGAPHEGGETTGPQLEKVRDLYAEAVRELAVRLSH
jgi:hypothetical protein